MNVTKKSFKGTPMFASRKSHFGITASRGDDLESLGYTLAFLYKGYLPWSNNQKHNLDFNILGKIKNSYYKEGVFSDLPKEFKEYFAIIDKIEFEETPNYDLLKKCFLDMAKRYDFKLETTQFEWNDNTEDNVLTEEEEEILVKEEDEKNEECCSFNDEFHHFQKQKLLSKMFPVKNGPSHFANLRRNFKKILMYNQDNLNFSKKLFKIKINNV